MSRIINTKRNLLWSCIDYVIVVAFQFVSRTVIVNFLGLEYLGLSSLFTSVLQVLNITELGISSAIIYSMYKPLADGNNETVCALMMYYKRIYRYIGIFIFIVGLLLIPVLPSIIKGGCPSEINFYLLYILFLIDTVVSYLVFPEKITLLTALQRLDLAIVVYCVINIIQYVLQVLAVVLIRNYYLYIIIKIFSSIIKNIIAAYIATVRFPEYFCFGNLSKVEKKEIFLRVKGLFIGKISGVTYTTLDSIIISANMGINLVAIYNNYIYIYMGVYSFFSLVRNAMQASIGNSVASESIEKNYNDILKFQYLFSLLAIWGSTCMLCIYQPFMTFWMGSDKLLKDIDVLFISLWFLLDVSQIAFYLYLNALGLWLEVKWVYVMSTICNLVLNIILSNIMGMTGIILATVIASFVFGAIWQCYIVFKHYFKQNLHIYVYNQIKYYCAGILCWIVSFYICNTLFRDCTSNFVLIVTKLIICSIVVIIINIILFKNNRVFRECRDLVLNIIKY